MDEDDKTKIETRSRIVILDTEDVSELFKKKQDMRMSEDDSYRSVGASISIAVGQSIDVTRSEKGYADLLKSVREECEQGLSVALDFDDKNKNKNEHLQMCLNVSDAENEDKGMDDNEKEKENDKKKEKDNDEEKEKKDEDKKQTKEDEEEEDENFFWSYLLTPRDTVLSTISKKCSAIANITILFRGRADEGILTIVDSAYLTFNERVIDIASIAPNQDDRRVATFRGFPESQPFLFSCMSEKDELKIFIRFKKCPKAFGKEMVRILADLFCFETQDDFLHQSWILPLKFDEGQELFYDCSKTPATLTTRGNLGAPPDVLARRASRGWPHSMEFESEESDSDASKSQNSHESEKSSSSSTRLKNEMRMRMEWQRRLEADAMEKRAKERAKTAIASMTGTLHLRGRAYSDEDVFHIQRLFGASSGMSPEGEALCAIEIARWKAQKQLLEDELALLNKEIGKKEKEKEENEKEKEKEKEKEIEEENDKNVHVMPI